MLREGRRLAAALLLALTSRSNYGPPCVLRHPSSLLQRAQGPGPR